MVGHLKRPLELIDTAQPVKYFKHFDVCISAEIKKPREEDRGLAYECHEDFVAQKYVEVSVQGQPIEDLSGNLTPGWEDKVEHPKTEQLNHATKHRDELCLLEEMRPIADSQLEGTSSVVESQARVCPEPPCGTSLQHPSYSQPSSSQPTPVKDLRAQESGSFPEFCEEKRLPPLDGSDELPRRKVPIGSEFQAFVPIWRSSCKPETSEVELLTDDSRCASSRWLGFQVWPLPRAEHTVGKGQIGRGRSEMCNCVHPDSVGCIRLHIQEESVKLKDKLGGAYYLWGFDSMGESVAQSWSEEEQKHFKALVKSTERNFWHNLPSAFPHKVTKDFVSYYFNAFILQRRAFQNRLDTCDVDSDDDDSSLVDYDEEGQEPEISDKGYAEFEESDKESWQCITDSEDFGLSERVIHLIDDTSGEHDAGYFTDEISSPGSIDLLTLSTSTQSVDSLMWSTSKEDSLVDFDNLSQSLLMPPYHNMHCQVQASGNHCSQFDCDPCERLFQEGSFWEDFDWEGLDDGLEREKMLVSRNFYDLDTISDTTELEIESEIFTQSSSDICSYQYQY